MLNRLRFARWQEVRGTPRPPRSLQLTSAMWLYAQAFAAANLRDAPAAEGHRAELSQVAAGEFERLKPFGVPAKQMAELALAMVDGELARTAGQLDAAVSHFRRAQMLERALPYTEPAYWHQPVAHYLGAALLQGGRPAEAEAVYRESLQHYRRDGQALKGLVLALEAQGRGDEARIAGSDFDRAWSLADVRLVGPRF